MLKRLRVLGSGVTTDKQLEWAMRGVKGFVGVMDRTEWIRKVYRKMRGGECAIINLDSGWKRGGTHWVSVCISRDGKYVLYKDSFGVPPPEDFYGITDRIVLYGTGLEQGIDEENCGQRSVEFLRKIMGAKDDVAEFYKIA